LFVGLLLLLPLLLLLLLLLLLRQSQRWCLLPCIRFSSSSVLPGASSSSCRALKRQRPFLNEHDKKETVHAEHVRHGEVGKPGVRRDGFSQPLFSIRQHWWVEVSVCKARGTGRQRTEEEVEEG
jgi:hypothetical protein